MQKIAINKYFVPRLARLVVFGLTIMAGNLWAAASAIEGMVKDANGRPIGGADIRIEAKNQSSAKAVKSDAKGHYFSSDLTPSVTYRVSLLMNGVVKASINNVQTKPGDPTQLNFDLKKSSGSQAAAPGKKPKHFVWVPAETGTHIGGRWVEVDDNGDASASGANRVQRLGAAAVSKLQSESGVTRGGN